MIKAGTGRFHQYRGTLLLVLFALVLWLNSAFIKPLAMGAIFAVVLFPLMGKLQRLKLNRAVRAGLITLGFTIVILVPIGVVIMVGADAALEKLQTLETLNKNSGAVSPWAMLDALGVSPWIDKIAQILPISDAQVRQSATKGFIAIGGLLTSGLQAFVSGIPGVLFSNIVIVFTIFFLLIDGPRAVHFIQGNSIFGRSQTDRIIQVTRSLCHSVIVASLVAGAVQATIIGLACAITGTEGILLIVFVSFLASFFPMVGTAPVTIFLTLQAFLSGDTTSGIIFLISIPIVGTSDNIVRPYVLKGGAELHPLIGFVAAFGALEAIGFYGLFIGPIVAGLFFTLLPMVTRSYASNTR
ncbi:MAG TPA: AI-2E family transporter [Bdellovibrionales bacterium]|jgi:predicted PurR-regulated permease PerM|nr:AI-2E family transporter [Bdellovibrionales bacterium]